MNSKFFLVYLLILFFILISQCRCIFPLAALSLLPKALSLASTVGSLLSSSGEKQPPLPPLLPPPAPQPPQNPSDSGIPPSAMPFIRSPMSPPPLPQFTPPVAPQIPTSFIPNQPPIPGMPIQTMVLPAIAPQQHPFFSMQLPPQSLSQMFMPPGGLSTIAQNFMPQSMYPNLSPSMTSSIPLPSAGYPPNIQPTTQPVAPPPQASGGLIGAATSLLQATPLGFFTKPVEGLLGSVGKIFGGG